MDEARTPRTSADIRQAAAIVLGFLIVSLGIILGPYLVTSHYVEKGFQMGNSLAILDRQIEDHCEEPNPEILLIVQSRTLISEDINDHYNFDAPSMPTCEAFLDIEQDETSTTEVMR